MMNMNLGISTEANSSLTAAEVTKNEAMIPNVFALTEIAVARLRDSFPNHSLESFAGTPKDHHLIFKIKYQE